MASIVQSNSGANTTGDDVVSAESARGTSNQNRNLLHAYPLFMVEQVRTRALRVKHISRITMLKICVNEFETIKKSLRNLLMDLDGRIFFIVIFGLP